MTEEMLYESRPVFTVDGEDIDQLARDLVHLSVSETLDGLKSLEARFVAIGPLEGSEVEGLLYMDGQTIDFGKRVQVAIGHPARQRYIFDGFVSAIEVQFEEAQVPEFCFSAEDKLMDLRMTRRSRTFEDMSDEDIVRELAEEQGLATEIDAPGPVFEQVQQYNMSDLAFMRERARMLQAELWLDGDVLRFAVRDRREASSLQLIRGNDLITVSLCADLAHQRTKVHVLGYDANEASAIDESVGSEVISAESNGGISGAEVLENAFGERVSKRVMEVPLNADEARTWAENDMKRRGRSFVTVNAVAVGKPDMMVGSILNLEQVGEPFNGGGYYVTKIEQEYSTSYGHRTHFEAQRATVN